MNNEAIQKINKMGKVATVLSKIAMVCCGIGLFFTIVAAIACMCMPKDLVHMDVQGNSKVEVDLSTINVTIPEDMQDSVVDSTMKNNSSINVNGTSYVTNEVDVTDHSISIMGTAGDAQFTLRDLGLLLIGVSVMLLATMVLTKFIMDLCKLFKECETPFTEEIVNNIRKIAICLIPWVLINNFVGGFAESFLSSNRQFNIGVSANDVVLILCVFTLSYIFRYGTMLQKESDETL